ncbi:MAG: hypothetical protein DGJ47_000248 [Rickettsiaceae bacterium]
MQGPYIIIDIIFIFALLFFFMNRINRIKDKLAALNPHKLKIIDQSKQHAGHAGNPHDLGETHFTIQISSESLNGKSKVQQHRIINDLLREEFNSGLHALSIIIS